MIFERPGFTNYTQEKFSRYLWTWNWRINQSDKKWHVESLIPSCPKCNHRMLITCDISGHHLECTSCGFKTGQNDYEDRKQIERSILQTIQANYRVNNVESILGNKD